MFFLDPREQEALRKAADASRAPAPTSAETTPELPAHFGQGPGADLPKGASQPAPGSRLRVGGAAKAALAARLSPAPHAAATFPLAPPSAVATEEPALPRARRPLFAAKPPAPSAPAPAAPSSLAAALVRPSRDPSLVAVTVQWEGPGTEVALVGSFTHWRERLPLRGDDAGRYLTVHLPRGEHQYLFEVDGALVASDAAPVCAPPPGAAPADLVNTITVCDGADFEGADLDLPRARPFDASDSPGAPQAWPVDEADAPGYGQKVPSDLPFWGEPPSLPPHLERMHGVSGARRRRPRAGRPPECHADLDHAGFARGCPDGSPVLLSADAHPSARDRYAHQPAVLFAPARWRDRRVTSVLYKPAPAAVDAARRRRENPEPAGGAIPELWMPPADPAGVPTSPGRDPMSEESEAPGSPKSDMSLGSSGDEDVLQVDLTRFDDWAPEDPEPLLAAAGARGALRGAIGRQANRWPTAAAGHGALGAGYRPVDPNGISML